MHKLPNNKQKGWDLLLSYEKRLVALAGSDKHIKAASRKKADEAADQDEEDMEPEASSSQRAAARPRPRPRTAQAAPPAVEEEEPEQGNEDEAVDDDDEPMDDMGDNGAGFEMDDDLELPDADAADAAALAANDDDRMSRVSAGSYNQVRPRKKVRRL